MSSMWAVYGQSVVLMLHPHTKLWPGVLSNKLLQALNIHKVDIEHKFDLASPDIWNIR